MKIELRVTDQDGTTVTEGEFRDVRKLDQIELRDLVEEFTKYRDVVEAMGAVKTLLQKRYDRIREGLLPEAMEGEGVSMVTFDDLGKITLETDVRASIPAKMREDAYKWLEEQGYGDLITETVNAGTLRAFIKKLIKEGDKFPEELFSVRPFTRAKLTKV